MDGNNIAIATWEDDGGCQEPIPVKEKPESLDMESMKMWKALHGAFDFFNDFLFNGRLDRNRVVLNCSRRNRTLGFYCPPEIGWVEKKENGEISKKAEISVNPEHMHNRTLKEIMSTFVHEMCHFEQDLFGKPGKRGYHNKEWAAMMEAVGLESFDINNPSKRTGMRCSHRVIPDGPFEQAMKLLPEEFKLPFLGLEIPKGRAKTGYQKWRCPECGQLCRAKETAELACVTCTEVKLEEFMNGDIDLPEVVKMVCVGF